MKNTWWKSGSWNTICDICGFKFKSEELRYTGDVGSRAGYMACKSCYDPPHPQEFIRPIQDQNRLPWTRPEATDTFVSGQCTGLSRQAIPGLGTPGCAIPGLDLGIRTTLAEVENFH